MIGLEALKKQPLFSWISNAPLEFLIEQSETRSLKAGEVLYAAGSSGDAIFLIQTGVIEFKAKSETAVLLKSGDLFGECSLIEVKERPGEAKAQEASSLLVLTHEALYTFSLQYPDPYSIIVTNLARCMAARIRELNEKKASASAENVPQPEKSV